MPLTLLLGGARSGKSTLAGRMMSTAPEGVVLIATAEGGDEEMRERISRHRASRPPDWVIVEEPIDISTAIAGVGGDRALIIDCLTLWTSNLMGLGLEDREIEDRARTAATVAASRVGRTVVVSNDVGSGIVPDNPLARRYRDLLGRINTIWADASDSVYLTVAGGVVPVQRAGSLWTEPARD
jgi:adenosyl cobinamide kinase/adenosyl cobinamide phosphate guanylyltransferase